MTGMPAQQGHSAACCNIPPVVSKGYEAKGTYEELGGYKSYVTGPSSASKGIIAIYDIFGFFPQTLQGADILSSSHSSDKFKVFIPDWFEGKPCPIEIFPPDTKEKEEQLGNFFKKFPPPGIADKVPAYVKAVAEKNPEIKTWAILGYCWGGKVTTLVTSSDSNPFKAAAVVHPAMVDHNDAQAIKVPFALLASKDEPADEVKKFEDTLKVTKHVEIFGDQIHGWMAARSDLEDKRVLEEYTRGYETVLDFFAKNV